MHALEEVNTCHGCTAATEHGRCACMGDDGPMVPPYVARIHPKLPKVRTSPEGKLQQGSPSSSQMAERRNVTHRNRKRKNAAQTPSCNPTL